MVNKVKITCMVQTASWLIQNSALNMHWPSWLKWDDRILFDTGGNPDILQHNAKVMDFDLSRLSIFFSVMVTRTYRWIGMGFISNPPTPGNHGCRIFSKNPCVRAKNINPTG